MIWWEFSRKTFAAADFFTYAITFEPCGLNQMICMKYGVLPIVAKTGGLKDSVVDFTDLNYADIQNTIGIISLMKSIISFGLCMLLQKAFESIWKL